MLIELKWLDPNKTKTHRTEIFRSSVPFTVPEQATLIATVESGINTYLDTDVEQNAKYYYRLRLVSSQGKSPISRLFTFEARPYCGPGSYTLQFGDEHFGYYGTFPDYRDSVPSLNYIRNILGLPDVDESFNCYPHKFAIGGSIRGTFGYPVAAGSELDISNHNVQTLIAGNPIRFTMGLHEWALIFPSVVHSSNANHEIEHYPGELRSMLGVITELYSKVEDITTGNSTGNRLLPDNGQVKFYVPLAERYPDQQMQWIVSSDWDENKSTSITWTGENAIPPAELSIEEVDYSLNANWSKTLIWPVLVYTSLTGPIA